MIKIDWGNQNNLSDAVGGAGAATGGVGSATRGAKGSGGAAGDGGSFRGCCQIQIVDIK